METGFKVVRLAFFQHPPSVPPFLTLPRQVKVDPDEGMSREFDESNVNEIAVGGGAVAVVVTHFPAEQKHPVGPLIVVGVRAGVLWLIDRLELDLAMQSNDVKRALQCLLTVSYSRNKGHETVGLNLNDIMSLTAEKEDIVESVDGVMKYAKVFLALIDAADATAQYVIAREALKRLAAAGALKGALQGYGRPSWRSVVQEWNQMLQTEKKHGPSTKTDAAAAFLVSLQEPKLTSLADAGKNPTEILPPGLPSVNAPISVTRKAPLVMSGSQQQPVKPLLLEGSTSTSSSAPPPQNQELLLQLNQGLHYQRKQVLNQQRRRDSTNNRTGGFRC